MASYTTAQVQQATNFKADAYINGVYLGVLNEGDHIYRTVSNDTEFGSAQTGSNGAIGVVSGGEHGEVELTLRNVNKKVIYEALTGAFNGVSTNISSPYAGTLEGRSNPRVKSPVALVVYPNFTAPSTGTEYLSDTSNPMAMCFPKAVYSGDFEFMMNADNVTDITLTFKALVDPASNNRYVYIGTGVSTTGTIA